MKKWIGLAILILLSISPARANCVVGSTGAVGGGTCLQAAGVLISTQTLGTAAANISFSGSNWSSSYTRLYLRCSGMRFSSTSAAGWIYVGEGAGPTWQTAAHYTLAWFSAGNSAVNAGASATTYTDLTDGIPGDTAVPAMVELRIDNVASSTVYKMTAAKLSYVLSGVFYFFETTGFWNNDTNPITGLQIAATSGNLQAGTSCSLYGEQS